MLARLFLLLVLLPICEIIVLAWLASKTSLLAVVALVIGMGLLGAALARHQGLQTLRRISGEVQHGQMPADSMLDGLLVLVAGLLLILPGVLSDVMAIGLLFPPTRRVLKSLVRQRLRGRVQTMHFVDGGGDFNRDQVIDVRVVESSPRQLP